MNLLSTSLLSALQTGVKILSAIVILKLIAVHSGPEGVAQLGVFQNGIIVASMLGGGLLYTGLTTLISAADETKKDQIFLSSLQLSLLASVFVAVIIWLGLDYWEHNLFNGLMVHDFLIAVPFMLFFYVMFGMGIATFNGERNVKSIVFYNITNSIFVIALAFFMAKKFGIVGLFIALIFPQAITGAYLLYQRRSAFFNRRFFAFSNNSAIYNRLLGFAAMGLVAAVAMPLAQITVRNYLIQHLGINSAGIWQGVTRISEVYLVFITASLSVYLLPKLAVTENGQPLKKVMIEVGYLLVPVALLMGTLLYILREWVILLLFTPEFLAMKDLFFLQICGDMVKIIAWLFAYVLLARQDWRWFVAGELIFSASYVLLCMLLSSGLGLKGAVYAYALNYSFYLIYVIWVVSNKYLKVNCYQNAGKGPM